MDARKIIEEVISLDDRISRLRDEFDKLPREDRAAALVELFDRERKAIGADGDITIGVVRATDMVCGLEEGAAAILAEGLKHGNPDVRQLAGEAIMGLAEDGLDEIAPAIDAALEAGPPASEEMPFILAMIDDPGVTEHITRFLDLDDADSVVAGIEALAETRDPVAIPALDSLSSDPRTISLEAGDGDQEEMTIGKLALEAIEIVESEE